MCYEDRKHGERQIFMHFSGAFSFYPVIAYSPLTGDVVLMDSMRLVPSLSRMPQFTRYAHIPFATSYSMGK